MIATLAKIAKHLHYLKLVDKLEDTPLLTSCVCSIISVLGESKFNENLFKSIIGVNSVNSLNSMVTRCLIFIFVHYRNQNISDVS